MRTFLATLALLFTLTACDSEKEEKQADATNVSAPISDMDAFLSSDASEIRLAELYQGFDWQQVCISSYVGPDINELARRFRFAVREIDQGFPKPDQVIMAFANNGSIIKRMDFGASLHQHLHENMQRCMTKRVTLRKINPADNAPCTDLNAENCKLVFVEAE